jgi:hypothetical protein
MQKWHLVDQARRFFSACREASTPSLTQRCCASGFKKRGGLDLNRNLPLLNKRQFNLISPEH